MFRRFIVFAACFVLLSTGGSAFAVEWDIPAQELDGIWILADTVNRPDRPDPILTHSDLVIDSDRVSVRLRDGREIGPLVPGKEDGWIVHNPNEAPTLSFKQLPDGYYKLQITLTPGGVELKRHLVIQRVHGGTFRYVRYDGVAPAPASERAPAEFLERRVGAADSVPVFGPGGVPMEPRKPMNMPLVMGVMLGCLGLVYLIAMLFGTSSGGSSSSSSSSDSPPYGPSYSAEGQQSNRNQSGGYG